MIAKVKKTVLFVLVVPSVIVLSYFLLQGLVGSARFRSWIQAELSQRSGYEVSIGGLRLARLFRFEATTIEVSRSGKVMFKTQKAVLEPTLLDFWRGTAGDLFLEKPVLRVQPKELTGPGGQGPPVISLRNFQVSDGELVVEGDWPFTLRSLHFSAKDFHLAADSGLSLQAHLPWLDGKVMLSMPAGSRNLALRLTRSQFGSDKDLLQANIKFQQVNQRYQANTSGRLLDFPLNGETFSADFSSELGVDPAFSLVNLLLKLNLARLPADVAGLQWPLQSRGPVVLAMKGEFAIPSKVFTLSEATLALGSVSLSGQGAVILSESSPILDLKVRARGIPVKELAHLFPQPLSGMDYEGLVETDVALSGPLRFPMITGVTASRNVIVRGTPFAITSASFTIPFSVSGPSFHAKDMSIEVKGLQSSLHEGTRIGAGEVQLKGSVAMRESLVEANGTFEIEEGSFSTRDESKIGEKFAGKGVIHLGRSGQSKAPLLLNGRLEITSLELLWNKFYGNFKERKPVIELEGEYENEADELKLRHANVTIPSLGKVALMGVVKSPLANPVYQFTLRADALQTGGIYDFLIRDTFKTSHPIAGELRLGGSHYFSIRTDGSPTNFSLQGELGWRNGEIRNEKAEWNLGPIDVEIPFRLTFPPLPAVPMDGEPRPATVQVHGGTLGSARLPALRTRFFLWNNRLELIEPLSVPIYGGSVQIDRLNWNQIGATSRDLSFAFKLRDLELQRLTKDLGWYSLRGSVAGSFPEVQWVDSSLRSRGEIVLEVFGGRISVKELEVLNPFSPLRSIKMDLRLDGIQLERASKTFEFGRIAGILEGTVDDLVIQNGQPASFRAHLQSAKKSGVDQRISVEALNKITVLSSGREASSLYGGLGRLFDSFRYSKLGFKAVLKNDQLVLHGVERRGGQEYLVVGSILPPSVNVISHTQKIGFGELVRRLERISGTGKTK